jgi:hypothetical protein
MKTNLPWVVIAVLLALFVTLHAQAPTASQQGPGAGRFQIVTGEISAQRGPGVFRIDSQSGEAEIYVEGQIAPNNNAGQKALRYGYWQRVDERWLLHDQEEELRQAGMRP